MEAQTYIDDLLSSTWRTRGGGAKALPAEVGEQRPGLAPSDVQVGDQTRSCCLPRIHLKASPMLPCEGRQRVIRDDEFQALLRPAMQTSGGFSSAPRHVPANRGLRGLTWARWIGRNSRFVLNKHKASRLQREEAPHRSVPALHRKTAPLAPAQPGGNPSGHIFLNTLGRPWRTEALSGRMEIVRNKAGIKADENGEQLGAVLEPPHLHHGGGGLGRIDGVLLHNLAGHTSLAMTARYAHLANRTLNVAAAKTVETLRPQRSQAREASEPSRPAGQRSQPSLSSAPSFASVG